MNKKLALLIAGVLVIVGSVGSYLERGRQAPAEPSPHTKQPASFHKGADDISVLTHPKRVVSYLQQHQRLPGYYIGKRDARRHGWEPTRGNLCQILPGKAIGGDRFSNRERQLPEKAGRQWYEADINYRCGRRGSERMLWSSDGLIYLTHDHYRHVQQVN